MTKISIRTASVMLELAPKTIYNLVSEKRGPVPSYDGRELYFTIDSIMDFMTSRPKKRRRIVESRGVNDDAGHKEAV